jgi:hypothetical protein
LKRVIEKLLIFMQLLVKELGRREYILCKVIVHDTLEILKVATNFYRDLFRKESRGSFSLEEDF